MKERNCNFYTNDFQINQHQIFENYSNEQTEFA